MDKVVKKFWSSVLPSIKMAINLILRPDNLETAVSIASQAEKSHRTMIAATAFPVRPDNWLERLEGAPYTFTDLVTKQQETENKQVTFNDRARSPAPPQRHSSRPATPEERYSQQLESPGARRTGREVVCYNCGEKNHVARFCMAPRRQASTGTGRKF